MAGEPRCRQSKSRQPSQFRLPARRSSGRLVLAANCKRDERSERRPPEFSRHFFANLARPNRCREVPSFACAYLIPPVSAMRLTFLSTNCPRKRRFSPVNVALLVQTLAKGSNELCTLLRSCAVSNSHHRCDGPSCQCIKRPRQTAAETCDNVATSLRVSPATPRVASDRHRRFRCCGTTSIHTPMRSFLADRAAQPLANIRFVECGHEALQSAHPHL